MDSELRDLSDRACIVGVGQTDYSKASGRSVQTLALQAARAAIADAGLKPADIDAILPYVLGRPPTRWRHNSASPTCAIPPSSRWAEPPSWRVSRPPRC